jgi:hypothetical protein
LLCVRGSGVAVWQVNEQGDPGNRFRKHCVHITFWLELYLYCAHSTAQHTAPRLPTQQAQHTAPRTPTNRDAEEMNGLYANLLPAGPRS